MSSMLAGTFKTAAIAAVACAAAVAADPAEKSTKPLDCNKNNKPYQFVVEDKSFDFVEMDWTSGDRTTLWSIEKSAAPGIGKPNACGISPQDSNVYCMVQYDSKGYLARVDKDGFAFVASSAKWSYSGTFDENGVYYMDAGTSLYTLNAPDMLTGYAKPWSGLPKLSKLNANLEKHKRHGADSVVSVEPGSGSSGIVSGDKYITVNKGQPVVTDLKHSSYKTWKPTAESGATLPKVGFGGAYWYSGAIYFSANDGSGVYKVAFTDSFKKFTATKVGDSYKTNSNDGMNCLFAEEPPTTPSTTPSTSPSTTASTESTTASTASTTPSTTPSTTASTASTTASTQSTTATGQESMPSSEDAAKKLAEQSQGLERLYSSGGGPAVIGALSARTLGAVVVCVALIAVVATLVSGSGRARTVQLQWTRTSQEEAGLDAQLMVEEAPETAIQQ